MQFACLNALTSILSTVSKRLATEVIEVCIDRYNIGKMLVENISSGMPISDSLLYVAKIFKRCLVCRKGVSSD